jgi:hypothetical protein
VYDKCSQYDTVICEDYYDSFDCIISENNCIKEPTPDCATLTSEGFICFIIWNAKII